jgi:hypothetical protein
MPAEISLSAGKKRLSAAKKHPLNTENLLEISGLGTIWLSWPAAEFLVEKEVGRELAAEFSTRPLACVFIMNTHFLIDIITRRCYLGADLADARGGK